MIQELFIGILMTAIILLLPLAGIILLFSGRTQRDARYYHRYTPRVIGKRASLSHRRSKRRRVYT